MIRFRRLTLALLNAWLVGQPIANANARYRLRLWREQRAALDPIRAELKAYIAESFNDARQRLRRGFEDTLSPFNDPLIDPAANYPGALQERPASTCIVASARAVGIRTMHVELPA